MKIKQKIETEIEISRIIITLPVRYGTEDIPDDFPLRSGDRWTADVEMDTGKILNWPDAPRFQECNLAMKVTDEGTYELLGPDGKQIAIREEEYVPHGVVPGEHGDYVDLRIKDGVITNWPKDPDFVAFFGDGDAY